MDADVTAVGENKRPLNVVGLSGSRRLFCGQLSPINIRHL
jgi:hypothetical protein